ncbi:MAG TPA: MEDS domain-containing protein [Terriglobales bacterium]
MEKQKRPERRESDCKGAWKEVSSYLDGTLDEAARLRLEAHFATCANCKSILDGAKNVKQLMGDNRAFDIPEKVSRRLYSKLQQHLAPEENSAVGDEIPVGITNDRVTLGSHLIYFWESDDDFARGVRFLYPGLGKNEHCIIFGHDEALEKVQGTLRADGYDSQELINKLKLTVIPRRSDARGTISDITDVVQAALRAGASCVRFLGNLGMGTDPLPAGEDDVLELEAQADALIHGLPCVIVCMYDIRTLSGRLILKGGLETHHLAVCSHGVQKNPYYLPADGHSHRHV